jgi:hypothetical protein
MWRRRPVGITVLAVVIIAVVSLAWSYFSGPSSSDCAPVREMLSFNKTQSDAMNAKTHIPEPGSGEKATEPSDLDYQNWADGLADRAAKVSAPELADQARAAAQTANRLIRARIDFNAQKEAIAPGGPPPPVGMVVTSFYDQFQAEIGQLSKSCG